MDEINFLPAAAIVLQITTDDGVIYVPATIQIGDENELPTMEEAENAIIDAVIEYAKMYEVLPDKIRLMTAEEAEELGFYSGEE